MATALLSPVYSSTSSRVSPRQPQRECERRPDLFDMPITESPASAVLFGPTGKSRDTAPVSATFDDLDSERISIDRFARAARKAVTACQGCFFLEQCQQSASERMAAGDRPRDEVVGAVAFNGDGVPEPRVHRKPPRRELDQLTFDEDMDLDASYRVDKYNRWLPPELEALPFVDDVAVDMALNELQVNMVVSQSYLDANPDHSADGRIVLTYADEWEALRRGLELDMSRYRLSQLLDCSYPKASEAAFIFGRTEEGYEPTSVATARRASHLADHTRTIVRRSRRLRARSAALTCRAPGAKGRATPLVSEPDRPSPVEHNSPHMHRA